jgi:superfamily II DNA or RNA helicase
MEAKDKIQSTAVALSKKHRFLCLEWCTGTGKTLAAGKIVEEILKSNPKAKGYLVCKESTHRKNWVADLEKHGKKKALKSMKTILYASLKAQKVKADFVVLDECHALTPLRIEHLRKILQRGTRIIFLSATIKDAKKDLMDGLCKRVHYYKIDLMKAIKLGLVPKPELVVHQMHLRKDVGNKLWDFMARKPKKGCKITKYCTHDKLYETINKYPKEVGIVCQGSEQEYYDAISNQMEYYKELSQDLSIPYPVRTGCRNKWLNLASQRKKFIAEVKTEILKDLVKQFRLDDSRFICFTGSINQAKILGADSAVHSKNSDDHNQYLIDCFNDMECKELFAVKMLREGVNLTQIERGIITQLDSEIGSFFQMLGRCLRHEFPEMHLIVLQDTQDVVYFNKSMKNFNKEFITWR